MHEWLCRTRPWWWWLNPWLYISRRDRAYADALDSLKELSTRPAAGYCQCSGLTVKVSKSGVCVECGRRRATRPATGREGEEGKK